MKLGTLKGLARLLLVACWLAIVIPIVGFHAHVYAWEPIMLSSVIVFAGLVMTH